MDVFILEMQHVDFWCISAGKVAERLAKYIRRIYKEFLQHSDNYFIPFAIETLMIM